MRLGVLSAKGSPGATTFALAAAAVTGGVLVEADPAGGDVICWLGGGSEPGLIGLAGALRHATRLEHLLESFAVEVAAGVRVVSAPVAGTSVESALTAMSTRLPSAVRAAAVPVVIDAGRWSGTQATAPRLAGCDVVAMVLSPTVAGVAHSAPVAGALREMLPVPVVAVVVGEHRYRPVEVAEALGVEVVGMVPWDRRAVSALLAGGVSRGWTRSALARSTRTLCDQLGAMASVVGVAGA